MRENRPFFRWIAIVALAPVLGLAGFAFQSGLFAGDSPGNQSSEQQANYTAKISALGGSGVSGRATFTSTNGNLQVQISARGLGEGKHPQHIHSGAECGSFGEVLVPLEPFPTATSGGTISYQSGDVAKPDNLGDRTVVLHSSDGTPVACGAINPSE